MRTKLIAAAALAALLMQATALPALALTKQVDGETVADHRSYPVIFIHGAAGAELDGAGGNYWPGTLWPNDSAFDALALAPDGKHAADKGPGVWPTRVMRYGGGWEVDNFPDLTFASVYNGFYDYMQAQGYAFEKPGDDGKVFYDFVYDWRQDNRQWTSLLEKKVNAVLAATKSDKVILMGHSMGTIQVRLFMQDPKRAAKVGGAVMMGGPQHGATQVFWAYTEGYNFGNAKVSDTKMWEIMKNWPAGYQLLPDWTSVRDKKTGRIWTLDEMYGDGFISEQEYAHYQAAKAAGKPYDITYGLPNAAFRRDVVPFHQALGDTLTPYGGKWWVIKGDGMSTLQLLDATMEDVGLAKPLLKLERVELKDGDGTVPGKGYQINGADSTTAYPGVEHGGIPSDKKVQVELTSIRKEVNKEEARAKLPPSAASYASSKLSDLAARQASLSTQSNGEDKEPSLISIIFRMFFSGQKDEKKVKARDELFQYAFRNFANAHINVRIQGEKPEDAETLYLVTKNFAVTESGLGGFEKPSVTVTLKSMDVFNQIVTNKLDGRQALKSGQADIGGSGLGGFKLKLLSWINKYVKF